MNIFRKSDGRFLGSADDGEALAALEATIPKGVAYTVTYRDNEERRGLIRRDLKVDIWSIAGSIQCLLCVALRWLVIIIKHLPAARAEIERDAKDAALLAKLLGGPDWSDRANPDGADDAVTRMGQAAEVLRKHPKA